MTREPVVFIYVDNMVVKRITDIYTRKVRSIDPEDLRQELLLHLVEKYSKLLAWREEANIITPEANIRMDKLSEEALNYYYPKVFNELKSVAIKYIKKETPHIYKGKVIDDHFYNEARVKAALPFIWQITPTEEYKQNPQTGTVLNKDKQPSNQSLALAIMADIKNAYYDLRTEEQDLLELIYNKGLTYKEIGVLYNATEDAITKRVGRVIEKMLRKLSGPTSYWDSEKLKGTQPDG
jgi:RNA polymerase sigma factor (sigma-70 family)